MEEGDFSHIKDKESRRLFNLTYQAVTDTDSWGFLEEYHFDENDVDFHSQLMKIVWECEKAECCHTEKTWRQTMKVMSKIAKKGWENYILGN